MWIIKLSKPHIWLRWELQPFHVNTCTKKKDLTTCTITQMIFILLQTYVISQLISSLSPPTDRHMVLCSPMALAKEWICISWDLRSLLPWNEFYTSLIPDLLFTPWPNMQVGLPDAWLDRNDCSGTQQPPSPERRSQTEASSDSEERGMSLFLPPPHRARTNTHASFNSSLLRCLTQMLSKSSSQKQARNETLMSAPTSDGS